MVAKLMAPSAASRVCGIALSDTKVAAVAAGGGAPWQRTLSPLEGNQWGALAQALREGVDAGAISSPVRLALLPPLVETRTVSIPPVNEADARRLLTRAASRHFVGAREPVEVGVAASPSGAARLAAAVSARVLRAILDAAREAQLDVDVVVPAQSALAGGAQRTRSGAPAAPRAFLVAFDETTELLIVEHGVLVDVRRFRRRGDEEAIAEATRAIGDVTQVADPLTASAAAMATHAADGWSMMLNGARADGAGNARSNAPAWRLLGAAALLALGTVALQEWDVRRELAAVRAERAALAPKLAAGGNRSPDRRVLAEQLDGPAWSGVLAAVGEALPSDAFITHLRAHGDTLVLEGNAVRATTAFDALAAAPWVRAISASAPIRRETADDGAVTEKFEFTLTLQER